MDILYILKGRRNTQPADFPIYLRIFVEKMVVCGVSEDKKKIAN